MIRHAGHPLIIAFFLLLNASLALGASVSISSSGDGVFVVSGSGMDGVAAMDLTIDYDSSSLGSPTISKGRLVPGQAMFAGNPNFGSSAIKIAIASTSVFSGSGQIATIAFASHTGTGSVTLTASMFSLSGASVAGGGKSSAADYQTSTTSASSSSSQSSTSTTSSSSSSTSTSTTSSSSMATYLGTVSMSSDVQAGNDARPAGAPATSAQSAETEIVKQIEASAEEKSALKQQKPGAVNRISYKGILEDFRVYKGKKTPAALVALFNKNIAPAIRQEPAIALSDGKTTVKILAKLETADDKMPTFTLNAAKLISLNRDNASGAWIVEVLPKAKTAQSSLTILTGSDRIEYPLTLAPPVKAVSASEADFAVFLKDSGATTPRRDLNGDGKHDCLDDFIYTANYLARKDVATKTKKK
jgi:hypothetical protein